MKKHLGTIIHILVIVILLWLSLTFSSIWFWALLGLAIGIFVGKWIKKNNFITNQ